jgi:hypothetical protein
MDKITTIKLNRKTKERLDKLKEYRRESYDEVLEKILDVLNIIISDPDRARAKLSSIERQRRSLEKSKVKKTKNKQIKKVNSSTI